MKKAILIFSASVITILCGCQSNSGSGNVDSNAVSAPSSAEPARTESEAPASESETTLTIVKAQSDNHRFVDWGSKPEEEMEGPTPTWVWTGMMCGGFYEDDLMVSSTLAPQGKYNYNVRNLSDDNPTSAWVEGDADYGIGEYIEVMNWSPMGDGTVSILNGYQASRSSWENNSRVKQLKVSLDSKDYCIIELADVMGIQEFKFPKDFTSALDKMGENRGKIRFTILDVYPGLKWKDTAISEIFSCGG